MDRKKKIEKILIANRGEIAQRIIASCKALQIKTVAIYTKEDQSAQYIYQADEALPLSGCGSAGYLDQIEIISLAKKSCADAIHPGYGFLSENGSFAELVETSGIIWIGPSPKQIETLADKSESQKIMKQSGVPLIPGKTFDTREKLSKEIAKVSASSIGFPILLKCAHGGGGKGMRRIDRLDEFDNIWDIVCSESRTLFHSHTIILEKVIINPRHIEVQIAGDGDQFVHLFERECSIQRRHQKIIEESPSLFIKKETKEQLYSAAIKAATAVRYKNIGTVEFLVDQEEQIYFLEVNTRLQVEHSVTELTTGIDLVELQIRLAEGERLSLTQEEISQHNHAIECRIYAEDPEQHFAPSTGKISHLILPNYPYLRIDRDIEEGSEITPFFDPMIMKYTTSGQTRKRAIKNMIAALSSTSIFGIETNIAFLQNILLSEQFVCGNINTQLLEDNRYLATLCTKEKNDSISKELEAVIRKAVESQLHTSTEKKQDSHTKWKDQQWK